MSFFGLFKQTNINEGVEEYKTTPGALLIDVRSPEEYREGHIPESKNVPLDNLDKISPLTDNKDTALYLYCYSVARSSRATGILRNMGYTNVKNIGGISSYSGKVEK